MKHEHKWSKTGLLDGDDKIYPCLIDGCPAQKRKRMVEEITIDDDAWPLEVDGIKVEAEDDEEGAVKKIFTRRIEDYELNTLGFRPGEIVIDYNAHVGVFSIWLAKRWPDVTIYAYEPVPENFERLQRNIKANGVENVHPVQATIANGPVTLHGDLSANSAAASPYLAGGERWEVKAKTLKDVLKANRCRLLLIDAEGLEYQLINMPGLDQVDEVRGEIHKNKAIHKAGFKPGLLRKYLEQAVKKVEVHTCKMAD